MARKQTLSLLAGFIAFVGLGLYQYRAEIAMEVAGRVAIKRLSADRQNQLEDGLHIAICGAGSPFPDELRTGPCTVIIAGKRMFVFDAGSGATRNINKFGLNTGRIDGIFLTHFHSDHIDGLGELLLQRWVAGSNTKPTPVYGPTGVQLVLEGLKQTYLQDQHYRVAHHGDATVPASGFGSTPITFTVNDTQPTVVLKDQDLEILAFKVNHAPVHPSIGYRIAYKGRSVVISGDTTPSANVQQAAMHVDVLAHEALSKPMVQLLQNAAAQTGRNNFNKVFNDILDYHSTPEEAATIAQKAGVGMLVLNHIVPTLPPLPGLEKAFLGQAPNVFSGPIRVAVDGDWISLPSGSKAIDSHKGF